MLIFGLILVLYIKVVLGHSKNETDLREGTTTDLSTAKGTVQGGRSLHKVNTKFYTPVSIGDGSDPKVQLCKLDWLTYSEAPHKYPMFKDLIRLSKCSTQTNAMKSRRLSELWQEYEENNKDMNRMQPSGFIFHESRVGSTLAANAFGSDHLTMVFSESAPPANVLLHCVQCTPKTQRDRLRKIILLMSQSTYHQRVFFKFQSITTTRMNVILREFSSVPWGFVFRQPIQTIMSHLDPRKAGGGPCLRYKSRPFKEASSALEPYQDEWKQGGVVGGMFWRRQLSDADAGKSEDEDEHGRATLTRMPTKNPRKGVPEKISLIGAPREASCAAHLNMLCLRALQAYDAHAVDPATKRQRGLFMNYESLPGVITSGFLPMAHIAPSPQWVARIREVSSFYSKGSIVRHSSKAGKFLGDSKDKDAHATKEMHLWTSRVMSDSYYRMNNESARVLRDVLKKDDVKKAGIVSSILSAETVKWRAIA